MEVIIGIVFFVVGFVVSRLLTKFKDKIISFLNTYL